MSETCAFVSAHPADTPRERAKVGHGALLPGARLRVVDPESAKLLGVDEEGELCVSGATRMLGYLGRAPDECFDEDGFFRTGDAGHVSADGNVHWSGRRTEMIKTAGANVSPAELEVALRACPPVKLSRVLGVPDARLDQAVVACIVLRDEEAATAEDVKAFLRERIAAYKVPKHVLFFDDDEMPMTGSDAKVRDDALLELVHARLATAGVTSEGER
jgi:acyl-CoA synthetase (AMP-forming)/AMP-acid ligase II